MRSTIKSANASLVCLSIRCFLSSSLDVGVSILLHTEQLLNSSVLYDVNKRVRSHLGCWEYTVWSTISVYGPDLLQIWHFGIVNIGCSRPFFYHLRFHFIHVYETRIREKTGRIILIHLKFSSNRLDDGSNCDILVPPLFRHIMEICSSWAQNVVMRKWSQELHSLSQAFAKGKGTRSSILSYRRYTTSHLVAHTIPWNSIIKR